MLIFPAANDLVTAFVGLEILSLPLYLLCGLARRRRLLSQEAALKYFLLGAMSSAIFLYGAALLYAYAGSFRYSLIDAAMTPTAGGDASNPLGPVSSSPDTLLVAGLVLVAVGLLFKVGAVPFHSWVPDVYTGSPTPVSAFMAVCTKIAAVFALIRVLYVPLGGMVWTWQIPLAVVAVASMAVGAIFGLTQTSVKRLLAYSAIAHAGFVLVAIVPAAAAVAGSALVGGIDSVGAVWLYLAAYGLATLGAFAVVMMVRTTAGEETGMAVWAGFGRRNPLAGAAMTVFLLSLAGIPLTGGFMGKLFAFTLAWRSGFAWLAIVALAFSVVTAAFYAKLLWTMFWGTPTVDVQPVRASAGLWAVVALCVAGTIFLGVYPGPLTRLAELASGMLR
jgi:NADH-quinone oxidoreductase subunit N